MIALTRLNGIPFAINSDLIERVQETPDTILFMADGTSIIVRESQAKVIELITEYRASVLALAYRLQANIPHLNENAGSVSTAETEGKVKP
jgi:flagellar protein FlbD